MRALLASILLSIALCPTLLSKAVRTDGWAESQCLATALHYEARGEALAGRRAVYDVILHRMGDRGLSACGVIYQRGQFSWSKGKPVMAFDAERRELLRGVVGHRKILTSEKYLYFYSGEKPKWSYDMKCRRIGKQYFCRIKGE